MVSIPEVWVAVSFVFVAGLSAHFCYKFLKRRRTPHFLFGVLCLFWAFVALLSLVVDYSLLYQSAMTLLYFRLYLTFSVLVYPLSNMFATSFSKGKRYPLSKRALILGTAAILVFVWFAPLYPNEVGDDFTFESAFFEPAGMPVFELMAAYLWGIALAFVLRMVSHARKLSHRFKPLAFRSFLLGFSVGLLLFIFSFEVTTYTAPMGLYAPVLIISAIGTIAAFVIPERWLKKVVG